MTGDAPATIGPYEIIATLGKGGMAEVYLGMRRGPGGFKKAVALKCVLPELVHEPEFINLFLDEARLAAKLKHPNIVETFDLGQDDERYFMACEYLVGSALRDITRAYEEKGKVLDELVVALIVETVAKALHYAHTLTDGRGKALCIVHRDVSPHNLFLTQQGELKVLDFGIAKAIGRSVKTQTGNIRGKVRYMSPEQLKAQTIDGRSDVYSLAVTAFELLCCAPMFARESFGQIAEHVMAGQLPRLRSKRSDVSEEMEALIERGLQLEPGRRFKDALEMATAARELLVHRGARISQQDLAALVMDVVGVEKLQALEALRQPITEVARKRRFADANRAPSEDTAESTVRQTPRQTPPADSGDEVVIQPARPPYLRPIVVAVTLVTILVGGLLWWIGRLERELAELRRDVLRAATPAPSTQGPDPSEALAPLAPAQSPVSIPTQTREATPTRPRTKAMGYLTLGGTPGLTVFVDHTFVGTTPVSRTAVESGTHLVQWENPDGGIVASERVTFLPGATVSKQVQADRGSLTLRSEPWSQVSVVSAGSRVLGRTPLAEIKLWQGTYTIQLTHPPLGLRKAVSVTIQPGENTRLFVTLP